MARVARPIDPGKIRKLKERISDPSYMEGAVEVLAGRITDRLLDTDDGIASLHYLSESSSNKTIAEFLRRRE
jgi:hypothetical protein